MTATATARGLLGRKLGMTQVWDAENRIDRKSTRLNSSHVEISYAVFCLKKKKKKRDQRLRRGRDRRSGTTALLVRSTDAFTVGRVRCESCFVLLCSVSRRSDGGWWGRDS